MEDVGARSALFVSYLYKDFTYLTGRIYHALGLEKNPFFYAEANFSLYSSL